MIHRHRHTCHYLMDTVTCIIDTSTCHYTMHRRNHIVATWRHTNTWRHCVIQRHYRLTRLYNTRTVDTVAYHYLIDTQPIHRCTPQSTLVHSTHRPPDHYSSHNLSQPSITRCLPPPPPSAAPPPRTPTTHWSIHGGGRRHTRLPLAVLAPLPPHGAPRSAPPPLPPPSPPPHGCHVRALEKLLAQVLAHLSDLPGTERLHEEG